MEGSLLLYIVLRFIDIEILFGVNFYATKCLMHKNILGKILHACSLWANQGPQPQHKTE